LSRFLSSTWIDNVDDQPLDKSEKTAFFLDVAIAAAGQLQSFSIMPALRAQPHHFTPHTRHHIWRGREEMLVVHEILANRLTGNLQFAAI